MIRFILCCHSWMLKAEANTVPLASMAFKATRSQSQSECPFFAKLLSGTVFCPNSRHPKIDLLHLRFCMWGLPVQLDLSSSLTDYWKIKSDVKVDLVVSFLRASSCQKQHTPPRFITWGGDARHLPVAFLCFHSVRNLWRELFSEAFDCIF